jgi:hypothetical protein
MPTVSASARSLSRPSGPATPVVGFDARLLTFRARAADQAHAASTPGTTWPATRAFRQAHLEGRSRTPDFDAVSDFRRLNSARPARTSQPSASGTSSWSPPDAIKPRLFPGRSPRQSSANAAPGRFDACPRGPTPEGRKASISRTGPPMKDVSYTTPPSAFVTHTPSPFPHWWMGRIGAASRELRCHRTDAFQLNGGPCPWRLTLRPPAPRAL